MAAQRRAAKALRNVRARAPKNDGAARFARRQEQRAQRLALAYQRKQEGAPTARDLELIRSSGVHLGPVTLSSKSIAYVMVASVIKRDVAQVLRAA